MPYMNTQRFYGKLREAQLDAFLVFKPENFYYTTGFQNYFGGVATGVVRQAQAIVVLPADRQMKPSMIINSWEEVQARENSGFEDVRTFPLWIEIFDLQDLRGKKTRSVDKPVQYDMEKNVALLAQILREKGLTRGRLGLELDYISQK
ncbi:MAG: aminopeptidase P family N-terminal domain-containing protein, partial [Deltaproteobacteria bacterium]|nr:aminopeptidase P family N-terminal domain-containing protein [Deltaproteobacteria bacterium]